MKLRYPVAFDGIAAWAAVERLPVAEGRVRFAQYAILRGIAGSRTLEPLLVFKGGNALDFVWQPNRSTRDLDFSVDMKALDAPLDPERLRGIFARALAPPARELGIALQVLGIRQQPPGLDRTFVTFAVRIGYALPDERALQERIARGQPSTQVIPVELSVNEPICADEVVRIDDRHHLRVSTIEDIAAEKLRALLQQTLRNRTRRQDLLDLAVLIRGTPELDRRRIADFLLRKAAARAVPVSRSAFRDQELAERALVGYDELRETTRAAFIPGDEALAIVRAFVDTLPIPDGS